MSLLSPTSGPSDAALLANQVARITGAPRQLVTQLVAQWISSFDALWGSGGKFTPAQKLAAIGTEADELLNASRALVTFLITQLTGKDDATVAIIEAKIATMPTLVAGGDGSYTIKA